MIAALFGLNACSPSSLQMSIGNLSSVSGVVDLSVTTTSVTASACDPTISLYALKTDGSVAASPLMTATINSDGSYKLNNLQSFGFNAGQTNVQYSLEAHLCDGSELSRFVTGSSAQDISAGSSLLRFTPDVTFVSKNSPQQINKAELDNLQNLMNSNSGSDLQTTYQIALANPTLSNQFLTDFGFDLTQLQYSLPQIQSIVHVGSVNELQALADSVIATHWNPNITLAYIWKVDGVVKSTTKNFNWTPGKNEQGNYSLDLYVGIDNGSGLDITKSYTHYNYTLSVNNSYPATAPVLSLTSSSPTNSQVTGLSLNTGIGLSNCQSFSKLVFTESGSSAALTLPSSADFASGSAFTCTTAAAQAANFTMSSGDGNHTIALWAMDSSGNISQSSDFVNVILDQTPPVVSSLTVPTTLAGGGTAPVVFSVSDATSGVASAKLYYSADGSTFNLLADLTAASSPYSWTVPSDDTSTAILRLIAVDNAGNTTVVDSNTFTIDSTAPSALTLAFTTPTDFGTTAGGLSLSKTLANGVSVIGCSGDAVKIFFKKVDTTEGTAPTSPMAPLATDVGWISCAVSNTWTASTGDGEKTYYAWAMDTAGNVSAVSNALTFVLDQTSPTLSLTSFNTANLAVAGGTPQLITWNASDAHFGVTPVTLEYTLDGTTWVTITSTAANASNGGCSVPGGSTGCYSWAVPSLDGGGNPIDLGSAKIRVSVTDTPANPVSTQTGVAFQIRSSGPVLSSTTINDGATYAGTTLVNLKVALTDHGFSTSGMKVLVAQAATPVSDCTLPTTPVWLSWTNATTNIPLQLSVVNGTKKICAWAKNSAGLTSQASTFTCTSGIDCNNIDLEVGSPPVISSFTVSSSGGFTAPVGATITINWTANAQGILKLDNNPLSFAYTTDNVTWYDIGTNKDLSTVTDTSEQNPATQVMTWYGGLSGNPVSGSGTINFSSPSSGFARLRAVARDTANNLSIVAYSKVFNTTMPNGGVWQIYAGSTDFGDGGSGTSASLHAGYGQEIAIDPITGDIYAKDTSVGLRKLDVKTGKVSTYIKSGTLNLSTNGGAITAASRIAISDSVSNIVFSKDGFLYISMGPSGGVYKINVRNNTSTLYLGGGTGHDPSSNPFSVYVKLGPFVLDEDNTAYFWTDCLSDTAPASNAPYRMMKAVQNPDGTAGPLTTVIGNCQYGTMSASGTLASNSILGPFSTLNSAYSQYAGILPLNHGQTIYFGIGGSSGSHPLKVVNDGTDARLYRAASTISSSYATNMSLNPIDGQIYYTSSDFGISKFTPSLTAADNGETAVTSVASGLGTGNDCLNDGIDAATTCVYADTHIDVNSSGTVFFVDGVAKSTFNAYRVRYVDASNKINTILGTLPVYGDGLQKELLRANLAGIYYKKSSNNLTAFPQGLYLTSPSMVFGYIDPATGLYHTLWGNQQNGTISIPAVIGTPMSAQSPMGVVYSGGNGYPLSFDDDGLPWMRVQNYAVTIDSNKKIQSPDNSAPYNGAWDVAADGADPSGFSVSVYGGRQNFALMGNSLFLIGAYFSPPTYPDPTPQIRLLDFTNHVSPIILGKGYTVSQGMTTPTTVAAGDGTTTPVKNSPLSTADTNSTGALQYSNGNLFFTDGNNKLIHYITHPENPLLSSLGTLTINYSGTSVIKNFSVKDDGSQIFIISLAGGLYCYPLTVAGDKTWCPSSGTSPSLYNYAAQIGTLQGGTANMFTWMDDSNLLISTGTQILQYTLPTGP